MGTKLVVGVLVVVLGLAAGVGFLVFRESRRHEAGHERMRQLPSARLRRLDLGIRMYVEEQGALPASLPLTPRLGACCPDFCEPDFALWRDWETLGFSVDEPHYFSYALEVVKDVGFTARALGDRDCDGIYSTYELVGGVDGRVTAERRHDELE